MKLEEIIINKEKELKLKNSDKDLFKRTFIWKNASIIWELKLKSPNWLLVNQKSYWNIINYYTNSKNIKALSILIDEKYFNWDIKNIMKFRWINNKPVLFKEFILDKKQIDWAKYYWYDAILLIKKVLTEKWILDFINYSNNQNIYPIIEIDNEKDLKTILKFNTNIDFWIALNSRNLSTMKIDKNFHFEIYNKYKNILQDRIVFAFSWIESKNSKEYKNKFNWVLIGTDFMKQLTWTK